FETVADLHAGPGVLRELFTSADYRRHLEQRGGRQVVMVGYSDSNKDGGLLAARWALHRSQAAMVEVADRHGIELVIFHGRGGTISRGGGKTERAVMAAPPGTVRGHLRLTVQGEVIHAQFGLRGIALRTLETTLGATLRATALPAAPDPREERWRSLLESMAATARRAYRQLVYEHPHFYEYFRAATPIDVIERLLIGSRPAARRSKQGIENLRAIPWVFSWTQSRHLLPGWYGLGTAFEAAVEEHGHDDVAEMVREWPFLRALFEDVEMVLAKADLPIAARYARLAGDVGEALFPGILDEHQRTVELVLSLRGRDRLLDDDPTLQRSIELRNPYVDPMSLLQVDLLRRWREGGRQQQDLFEALVASVHGIARGLQNTG
ncbi:MAG: phosphoenolpyruvate carboxylase, partial [Holophagales bacterium]|nr:phosphoenolpyruvate carboxylase [Holophagales bacterium]